MSCKVEHNASNPTSKGHSEEKGRGSKFTYLKIYTAAILLRVNLLYLKFRALCLCISNTDETYRLTPLSYTCTTKEPTGTHLH